MTAHDRFCPCASRADKRQCRCAMLHAARADAIRYSDEIDRMVRELSAIRMEHEAEVAALRERAEYASACWDGCVQKDAIEAEVRERLRAIVDDRANRAADIYREEGGTYWEGSMDAYGAVLSFLEEKP